MSKCGAAQAVGGAACAAERRVLAAGAAQKVRWRVVADFSEWVALTHGPGDAMPAQVAAVCAYVAHLAKTRRSSTIRSYVAALDASSVALRAPRLREQPGGALALSVFYVERGAAASGT